ncbi:hypothetical protein GO730_28275 [Spirosoma sp. HMF3257]|uniref:Uncharacterized protein n=1 Tax=Spirosoma telluris TaxID=2183553 RepID=A0A327NPF2_9BACT|nr:hypothetical protein [Spirosoma telluris]RAI77102.1 hypothetical protein HMF3257_28220 [Spirosoma telluris]
MFRTIFLALAFSHFCLSDIFYNEEVNKPIARALSREYNYQNKNTFTGNWSWEKNNEKKDFSLSITKKGEFLIGQYCYTLLNGEKTDCAIKNDYSFKIKNTNATSFTTDFYSQFSHSKGKARITLGADSLVWEILQEPREEYYCPMKAILRKQ